MARWSLKELELLKYPTCGKLEAEAKISQDMSQHLKAEIPSLSHPGCGLCKELEHPWRRFWVFLQALCWIGEMQLWGELRGTRINQAFR